MVDELDELLTKRAEPQARSHLAEKIIAASLEGRGQKSKAGGFDLAGWFGALADEFLLPRPALAMAVFLVLGLFAGMNIETPTDEVGEDLVSYLFVDESFDTGDWL